MIHNNLPSYFMLKHKIVLVGLLCILFAFVWKDAHAIRCATGLTISPAATQNLCVGAAANILTATTTRTGTGTPGSITYTWYSNTVNSTSGGTVVKTTNTTTGTLTDTYTPLTTSVGTLYYYCIITNNNGTGCVGVTYTTAIVQVTVASTSLPTGIDGFRCGNGTVLLGATPGVGETIDWYATPTGGIALLTGSTTFTTPALATTTLYYAEARNTTTGCVSATRTTVTAHVYAVPAPPPGTNGARCGAGSVSLSAIPGAGETIDWYADATGGVALSTGSASFNTPAITSTTLYYAEARNPWCGATSPTRTVVTATINPVPTLGSVAQATAVCSGTNATINLTGLLASTAQTISYNINGGATQTANITSDAGGAGSFVVLVTSADNGQPLTITGISVNATSCNTNFSNVAFLAVNDLPSVTSQPGTSDQLVCKDSPAIPISVNASAGSGTITTYEWYSNTVSSTVGGTLVATNNTAATTDAYNPITSANGILYYYVVVTNSNGCNITSNVSGAVEVSGGSVPTITTQPSAALQEICINGPSTALTVAATGSSISYQWYSSPNPDGSSATLISGATSTTYTPITTTAGTLYYYCVVSSNSCSVVSTISGAIIVYPASVAGSISGATAVCISSNSTLLTVNGHTGNVQWQSSLDDITFNDIPAATSATYSADNLSVTTYYRVIVTSGVCSSATSLSESITVNPLSVAGSISGGTTVCYGVNSTLLTLAGHTGSVQWQSSTDDISFADIPGEISTTYTVTDINATTYYRAVVTSNPCVPATTASVTVTVLPINTTVWTGNIDSDWTNLSNWTCGIPDQTTDVSIPSGLTNYPNIGPIFTEVKNITISNGASLTLSTNAALFVYGDFTNNNATASSLFISDFSEIVFIGTGAHAINGPASFYYLTIDDAEGTITINVNGNVSLSGVLTLTAGATFNTNDQLTILSKGFTTDLDGSIGPIPAGAVLTGSVTVQRFMDPVGNTFRYLGSPVASALPPAPWGSNISAYVYNAGVGFYTTHPTSSPLVLGTGYVVGLNMSTPITWSVSGPITSGSHTWTFNEEGWHLVGNPFPSAIRWFNDPGVAWDLTNIATTIAVTDNSVTGYPNYFRYWSYNPADDPDTWGTGPLANGMVAMGQGFWVYVGTGGGSLTIYEQAKENNLIGEFYRTKTTDEPNSLKITLDNGKMADAAYLRIDARATSRYEFKHDLKKLWNPDLNLYVSDQSGNELVVSAIDKMERGKNIPVGITVSEAGDYNLSFAFLPGFTYENSLYLIDRQEGKVVPIRAGKYTFKVNDTARSQRDRFYLSLDPVFPERTLSNHIDVYPNPVKDKLTIRMPSDQTATIGIIDHQGKELFSGQMKGIYEVDMSNYAQGMYVLRILTEEGVFIRKIIR